MILILLTVPLFISVQFGSCCGVKNLAFLISKALGAFMLCWSCQSHLKTVFSRRLCRINLTICWHCLIFVYSSQNEIVLISLRVSLKFFAFVSVSRLNYCNLFFAVSFWCIVLVAACLLISCTSRKGPKQSALPKWSRPSSCFLFLATFIGFPLC